MSAPRDLDDIYITELKDLWSANDQMRNIVGRLAEAAEDPTLKKRLEEATGGIERHSAVLKTLLDECGDLGQEHCKGMEGLVKEAKKHAIDAQIDDPDVRDVVIIAQYQRMCHYGICGFGTAKAFAKVLGLEDHVQKLDAATEEIYDADQNMTDLAERSINLQAKQAEPA